MTIHPKTSASALGGALGLLLVSVLDSIHGINLSTAATAAIPAFLSTLGAFLSPSADGTATPTNPPQPAVAAAQAPPQPPQTSKSEVGV
jgi:hypothetical protein